MGFLGIGDNMAKTRGFGRRVSKDERDKQYLMRRLLPPATEVVLPTRKTWAIAAKNLDQTDYGVCVGCGWTNFLRCAPIQTTTHGMETVFQIYDYAIALDEWTDNDNDTDRQMGTSVRAGAEAVTKMGRLKSYLWAFELQPAVEWVLTMGPCVLGTNWYTSMFRPDAQGIVQIKPRDRVEGGHCFLWRGVDTRKALAHCVNSWGDGWNPVMSGDFLIPLRDVERLIREDGEVATAVEKRLGAKTV